MRSRRQFIVRFGGIVGLVGLLWGCGQKGPLFMPEPATKDDDSSAKTKPAKPAQSG